MAGYNLAAGSTLSPSRLGKKPEKLNKARRVGMGLGVKKPVGMKKKMTKPTTY